MKKGNLPLVLVRNLGKMSFNHALNEQKAASRTVLEKLKSNTSVDIPNFLFLVQHHPVYTVGIRNKQYIKDEDKLRNLGAAFVVTDRGGLITFHGPGQLVSYPVLYLGNFNTKKSIRWYIRQLENTIIETCSYFNLKANTTNDVGVWIENRKIAAIGVHGSRYVTTHGIALNCNVDLTWFSHIIPCGLENKEVTSLTKELQRNVSVEETVPHFLKAFQNHFPCELQFENVC